MFQRVGIIEPQFSDAEIGIGVSVKYINLRSFRQLTDEFGNSNPDLSDSKPLPKILPACNLANQAVSLRNQISL